MTAPEDQSWPDKRDPDNGAIDATIRGFGVDPVTKQSLRNNLPVIAVDYKTPDGADELAMALQGQGPLGVQWRVFVRSFLMTYAPGTPRGVGNALINCTDNVSDHNVEWSQTVSTTTSFSVTASVTASFYDVLSASVSSSFSMSWTESEEFKDTYGMKVSPKSMGWLERAPWLQTLTGEIWLLGSTPINLEPFVAFWGNGTMVGQATDGRPAGVLISNERRLTPEEERSYCSSSQENGAPVLPAALMRRLVPHRVTGTSVG
jgi:hypothetical protein